MADKFNCLGARTSEIKEVFSYFSKKDPFVFEIGCGNGRDAKEIVNLTSNYLGIDISEEMIRIARENVPKTDFQVCDIENCSLPGDIDIVFSFASLLHSDRSAIGNVLKRLSDAMSLGGIFYLSLKLGEYGQLTRDDEFGTRTYFYYEPEDIEDLASGLYSVLKIEEQEIRDQKWFTMILKKK